MPTGVSDSKSLLWVDGQAVKLEFTRTTIVLATALVLGTIYKITSIGTTDFTLLGAANNTVGLSFIANGTNTGLGTGTTTTEAPGMNGTAGTLTWNLPKNYTTYNGILITASIKEINPSNYPTDSVAYTASSDLNAPVDKIGNAQVIGSFYNDVKTLSLDVTGLSPNTAYFFSAHVVSNVYTYYIFGVQSYSSSEVTNDYAGDMDKSYGPPLTAIVGQVYYDETQKLVFVYDGSTWVPTSPSNVLTNNFDPYPGQRGLPTGYPALGDFFYNITEKSLKCWSGVDQTPVVAGFFVLGTIYTIKTLGTTDFTLVGALSNNLGVSFTATGSGTGTGTVVDGRWNPVELNPGTPIYQKNGVGTDLTNGARDKMIDVLKKQFGSPVVCVELIDDHYNIAVDNALQELRHRTDVAYDKQYFFMQIQQFQDIYYLNDPALGTDKIVDVLKIHRLNMLGLVNFAPDNIYAQQFLNQFYAPGVSYDLVSIHLISAMSETYSLLFAGDVAFNWREPRREMQIYKKFGTPEKVIIETSCERSEQELLSDRWVAQWVQQWAKSVCNMILANIRGKYTNLPGPGGGISMNASELQQEGQRLQEDCLRQIMDQEIGQNGSNSFYLPFLIG